MDFGFSDDPARHAAGIAWRDAAIADGWAAHPACPTEPVTSAAVLVHPENYTAHVITRVLAGPGYAYETSVWVWGPDRLALDPPNRYDMAAIRRAVRTCNYCGKTDCATVRVGFAGRACRTCQPVEEKRLAPGYYD